ncbi:MAG TPA: DUF3048 domain-containing protein [bacterium]|nr:DUF3048 domain-containing protein [bacterium]
MGLEQETHKKKFDFTGEFRKRKKAIIIFSIIFIVAALGGGGYVVWRTMSADTSKQDAQTPEEQPADPVEPEPEEPEIILVPSYLTGELIAPELAKVRPLAIVVENHSASRPPTGLIDADIVYEMPVEAGITRFLAVFQQNQPAKIGPERSSRVYFLEWVKEYDAVHAHIGQDPKVLTLIRPYGIEDLRETGAWWDDASTGRAREHRAYTSVQVLRQVMIERGLNEKTDLTSWKFKEAEADVDARPESQTITINYSSAPYQVIWRYDRENNLYRRENGGQPHIDASNSQQLWAKNVIVQDLSIWLRAGDDKGRRDMKVVGEGDLLVFRDGQVISGKWKKDARETRTELLDTTGTAIELNPGKIWVEIVPVDMDIVAHETIAASAPAPEESELTSE